MTSGDILHRPVARIKIKVDLTLKASVWSIFSMLNRRRSHQSAFDAGDVELLGDSRGGGTVPSESVDGTHVSPFAPVPARTITRLGGLARCRGARSAPLMANGRQAGGERKRMERDRRPTRCALGGGPATAGRG